MRLSIPHIIPWHQSSALGKISAFMHSFVIENRQKILDVIAAYGCTNPRVFGSMARGDATEQSDVDLLVDMPERAMGLEFIGMIQDLEKALGRKVDVGTEDSLNKHVKPFILKEAVPL